MKKGLQLFSILLIPFMLVVLFTYKWEGFLSGQDYAIAIGYIVAGASAVYWIGYLIMYFFVAKK